MPDKSQAQAIYLQYLTERATLIANSQRFLAFDPQGRVLTDVSLTLDDYAEIGTRISQVAADNAAHILPTQEGIAAALGLSITNPTTVSLDINDIQTLATKFNKALGDALDVDSPLDKKKLNPEQKLDQRRKILAALAEQPKGSIIALQQEFHFHLGLAVRTYQKAIPKFQGHDLEMQAAHLAAAKDVNKLVMAEFAQALKKAMQDNPTAEGRVLNLSVLNAELDAARKRITPKAHESLQKHILKKTGINLTEADLKKLKKVAEETTATANDVLCPFGKAV